MYNAKISVFLCLCTLQMFVSLLSFKIFQKNKVESRENGWIFMYQKRDKDYAKDQRHTSLASVRVLLVVTQHSGALNSIIKWIQVDFMQYFIDA